jgi:hypothetical protein
MGQVVRFARACTHKSRLFGNRWLNVRFTPNKRTSADATGMSAKCHEATYAVQQIAAYSITSSAMASSPGGKLRPNALAVLRLIASSNLVGCSIGRSVGLAPLA